MFPIILLLPLLPPSIADGDPCTPNPCGSNTRCSSTLSGTSPVISCECLIGYYVPTGGDPFDGCIEQLVQGGASRGGGSTPIHTTGTSIHTTTTISSIVPLSTLSPVPRSLSDDGGDLNRLQAGHRPGQLVPRKKTRPVVEIVEVDTEELFPEGNLGE